MKNIIIIIWLIFAYNSEIKAQSGCTDELATNYNSSATVNDGSCTYTAASVTPAVSYNLGASLVETSGLIEWNGSLYTHNDNTDTNIYQISKTGDLLNTFPLPNTKNVDWEEISQDENYIYIGDFGNNAAGNRKDLKIYKIKKSTLATAPEIETINFSYSDQTNFTAQSANNTDFDCESMIVASDGIYLFTKQWLSKKTTIYKLSNTAGTQIASPITTVDVGGLITGATFKENLHLLTLCGYNETLSPFIYLIYDFKLNDFAISNKRKIDIPLQFYQIEGIATADGLEYYLSNEKFEKLPFANIQQKLHKIVLNPYLENYISKLSINDLNPQSAKGVLYPNPTDGEVKISLKDAVGQNYKIYDFSGKNVKAGVLNSNSLDLAEFSTGTYLVIFPESNQQFKIIKK
ncbi:T9SS type A sorting domain-containing protein [Flavobacterium sp.]|uniref:T9SS type A sorting domain-containing protein n=1 Tax=Flavobacterium sp. TaxID=239 RepID=UPI002C0A6747|nr:T9SS type A sorting domain-containing protein [Flavobacterium sp.]HSD06580.1 T9SS type A sorting domain-containing protein [Flavobacterium sp.]